MVNESERGFYIAGSSTPRLANLVASSFSPMFVLALVMWMMIVSWDDFSVFMNWVM
jgi:hypothetical protein